MTPRTTGRRLTASLALAASAALALSACVPETPTPAPTAAASETATPTSTPTAGPVELSFTMPADCLAMLPQSRIDAFAATGLSLLGGPGSPSPQYYADKTPEERVGGISCIWGDEAVAGSTVEVSVAPISVANRGSIVDSLIEQGLNESQLDDGTSYAQIGDETSAPAVLNIIRDDSWISVLEAVGGEAYFTDALAISDDVYAAVYTP